LVALCMLVAAVVTIGLVIDRRTNRSPVAGASARITEMTRGSAVVRKSGKLREQVRALGTRLSR
jgi:hypothetical protein